MVLNVFRAILILASFLIAASWLVVLYRAHSAIMLDRWRRVHSRTLLWAAGGFWFMVIRRITAAFISAHPELAVYDQIIFPSAVTLCFGISTKLGLQQMRYEARGIELRQQFARDVSHELNTPLAIMLGYIESALEGIFPENGDTAAWQKARQGGRRLKWVVENLVYTATLSHDDLDVGPVSMTDVIETSIEEMTEKADHRQASITVKIESGIVIRGHRRLLVAAVANLMDNAIKFTKDDAEPVIEISLYQDAKRVVIEVVDHGIGIGDKRKREIFDAFLQVDSKDTRRYGGLGIGLWIVKRVMRLHRGHVELASKPDKGSTFWLIFPKGDKNERG